MKKRILSVILVLALFLTLMPMTVFATGTGSGEWFGYCTEDINYEDTIGANKKPLTFAIRIPAASLPNQEVLSKVSFYTYESDTYYVRIYSTAPSADPITAAPDYEQAFTVSNPQKWEDVVLSTPYVVDRTKDLWIGIGSTNSNRPATRSTDILETTNCCMVYFGGQWEPITAWSPTLKIQPWMIRGYFETVTPVPTGKTLPYSFDFETDPFSEINGWTTIDADNDGYDWETGTTYWFEYYPTGEGFGNNGSKCAISESYIENVGSRNADNWLFSPAITIPVSGTTVSWYEHSDVLSGLDSYTVYIGETAVAQVYNENTAPNGMKELYYYHEAASSWTKISVELSAEDYGGRTVYIAFRHQSEDRYWLEIDDFEVKAVAPAHTHDFTYTAKDGKIIATCGNDASHTATLTLTATSANYSGSAVTASYGAGEAGSWKTVVGNDAPTITYEKKGEDSTWSAIASAPSEVGEYRAVAKVTKDSTDYTAYKEFTISKAEISSVAFTEPTVAAAGTPATAAGLAIVSEANYTGAISWAPADTTFGYNKAYTATVTLTAKDNYKFAGTVTVPTGWTKSASSTETSLVLTKTYDATAKAKITSITAPSVTTQLTAFTTQAVQLAALPTSVVVAVEDESVTSMAITWALKEGSTYSTASEAENTFVWTITASEYANFDTNSKTLTGEVTLKNPKHSHDWQYSEDGAILYAKCSKGGTEGCVYDDDNKVSLTLSASNKNYSGSAYTGASLGDTTAWVSAVGGTAPAIKYVGRGSTTYTESDTAPTAVGTYTAKVTVGTATATKDFEITKATPYIKTAPAPTDIDYGNKLLVSTFFGGYVQVSSSNTAQVDGLFEWKLGNTIPALSDSETTEYDVTFTPADTNNYNTVSCKVKIKVNHTHAPVLVNGQAPQKGIAGWKDYYECICGERYEDAYGSVLIPDLAVWKAEGGNGYIAPLGYAVTFNMNGHGTQVDPQTVEEGNKATKPSDPTAVGWTFGGWYADETFNVTFNFDSTINANTTIYAKWTKNTPAPSGDSTPTVTVPVTGDENSVKVSATVSGSTATVKPIKDADLEKVTGGESVEIDLTGLKKDVDTAKIPTATVEKIGEQAGMSVKLTTATVSFDKTATQEISDQAKGNTVELVVDDVKEVSLNAVQKEAVEKLDTALIIDAYLVSGGTKLCTEGNGGFNGGKATVMLPYEIKNNRSASNYNVYYVDDAGKLQKLNAKYDKELAAFVFEIEHFSVYAVAYDENACAQDATCVYAKFIDANTKAWYHDGVHFCVENGYMQGVSNTKFAPTGTLSRAMIVTMLWRLEGEPVVNYAMSFKDVPADKWYTEAIRWAQSSKIVEGYSTEKFGPNDPITREQMATILYNYAKFKGQGFTGSWMFLLDFTDRADIRSYADEAVHWCSMKGIVNGKNGETGKVFDPRGKATRAEAASMVQRCCENILSK